MFSKFCLIIVLNVGFILCALRIIDNTGRELQQVHNRIILKLSNDLFNIACKSDMKQESLWWSILSHGHSHYCKENNNIGFLPYRVHLRDFDNNTELSCNLGDRNKPTHKVSVNIILGNKSGHAEPYCTSMSNVFCLNDEISEYVKLTVNKKPLEKIGDPNAGTYAYTYDRETSDVNVTCTLRTKRAADKLVLCGKDLNDSYAECSGDNQSCQVSSNFHSSKLDGIRVIYCYAIRNGIIRGNIAKLTVLFGHKTENRSMEVIPLSSQSPRSVPEIDNVKNHDDHRTSGTSQNDVPILETVVVILIIIVITKLGFVVYLYRRKSTGNQAHGNPANFVQNNSMIEFTVENNYYMSAGEGVGGGEPEHLYAIYDTPLDTALVLDHSPSLHNTTTYANCNDSYNVYGNTN